MQHKEPSAFQGKTISETHSGADTRTRTCVYSMPKQSQYRAGEGLCLSVLPGLRGALQFATLKG